MRAKQFASALGISRVTDITLLDGVGIPVFSSVRPAAVAGSLCVNAGKGIRPIDAKVGAYMEAIEFACAEPHTSQVQIMLATPRDVLDGGTRSDAILDFCPRAQHKFDLTHPLACTESHDIVEDRSTLVPAELVFLPYVGQPGTGHFGSHSNGLASGNTQQEALLHGLLEVLERDIRSFQVVRQNSQIVRSTTLPPIVQEQAAKIRHAGLELSIRTLSNEFALPCFEAVVWDPFARTPVFLNGGYGCHLHREIALLRALTEAVQSRLSWIHGGRDDLLATFDEVSKLSPSARSREAAARFAAHSMSGDFIDYEQILERAMEARTIREALDSTLNQLLERGIRHVCCVPLTHASESLQVVRVIVPLLEYLDQGSHRVGPRLYACIHNGQA